MKKLILVLMVLILAGAAQAVDLGLLNPGFEGAPDFTGWTPWTGAIGSYYDINETEVHDGNKSAEFGADANTWDDCAGAYQLYPVNDDPISIGSMLKLKGWCKATGASPYACLKIIYMWGTGDTDVIGYDEVKLAENAPTVGWVYGEATGLVPATCINVKFEVVHFHNGRSFFDDIVAELILDANDWTDPNDPNNMLLNHNFEGAGQSGERMVPYFWTFSADSAPGEYDHNQVEDVNALDGNYYWMLTDTNTSPDEEGLVGYQTLAAAGLSDTNSYNFSVYLRNPNMTVPATVSIGFGYYETTGYEDFWGKNVTEVTVPAGNDWYQYSYSALKWLDSGKMQVRVEVHGTTIHVDDVVLHDEGVDMCGLAGREATKQLGYFPLLPGDLNKDCYVDFQDMEKVAEDWLECTLEPNSLCP